MSQISIKSSQEIVIMRQGGRLLAKIMEQLSKKVAPGVDTLSLDKHAEELVLACGGTPAFKGYGAETGNPFPATICASLNEEIVHGIPAKNIILKDGDLLKIDIGMKHQGLFVDMARTFCVGNVSAEATKIATVVEQSFWIGIESMRPHGNLSDYSKAVQSFVEKNGFSVVRNLVGHGVGKKLHEDPQVPNYWNRNCLDMELIPGMTLALEPMVNAGTSEDVDGKDGWVFKTKDGRLSAHYENTILITESEIEVLTVV